MYTICNLDNSNYKTVKQQICHLSTLFIWEQVIFLIFWLSLTLNIHLSCLEQNTTIKRFVLYWFNSYLTWVFQSKWIFFNCSPNYRWSSSRLHSGFFSALFYCLLGRFFKSFLFGCADNITFCFHKDMKNYDILKPLQYWIVRIILRQICF